MPIGPWYCRRCESQERPAKVVSRVENKYAFRGKIKNPQLFEPKISKKFTNAFNGILYNSINLKKLITEM